MQECARASLTGAGDGSLSTFHLLVTPHNRIVPSAELVANSRPSGEKTTRRTKSVCPLNVCTSAPSLTRHNFTTPSFNAEASNVPSGENPNQLPIPCDFLICARAIHHLPARGAGSGRLWPSSVLSGENVALSTGFTSWSNVYNSAPSLTRHNRTDSSAITAASKVSLLLPPSGTGEKTRRVTWPQPIPFSERTSVPSSTRHSQIVP